MTQAQIGQQFGLFQMHVSRLIARARAISAGVSSISRTAPSLPPPPVRK
jgi:DNA-binding transcriptional regulator LsrR (DeoR family)